MGQNTQKTCVVQICVSIPDNAQELATDFLETVGRMCEGKAMVGNFDETPLWFDLPNNVKLNFKGSRTVKANTTGREKWS